MRFLIIDDDNLKIDDFKAGLDKTDKITIKQSYNSGLRELVSNIGSYDCLILDMNFPQFDNEFPQANLGLIALEEIRRRKLKIPVEIYTSGCVDASKYDNVIDYIQYDGFVNLTSRVATVKDKLKTMKPSA